VLRLSGSDRATWLQGLITNDVLSIPDGERVYAAFLTPQGRMISDVWVVPSSEGLLLDVPAPLAAELAGRLDALVFAEDVAVQDISASTVVLQVVGAAAPDAVEALDGAGGALAVVDDRTYGVRSAVLYVPSAMADHVAGALARRSPELVEVDHETFETFRIEAGVPRFLVDMAGDTIPLEAGIEDRAVSFTKGCYIGQEIIVRVTTRGGGRVARRLVGLVMDGPEPAERGGVGLLPAGTPLHAGDRAVGHLTSVTWSPRLGNVIGLGYVHRDFASPGTRLELRHAEQSHAAVVTALPFIAPAG